MNTSFTLWAAVFYIIGSATAAWAQQVIVRSGEHPGFSRLVIEFPERPRWQLDRAGNDLTLSMSGAIPAFDMSRVFRFIPRTRLLSLRQDPVSGALTLRLNCACGVRVFPVRQAALAIDIRDPRRPPEPAPPPEEAVEDPGITALIDGPVLLLQGSFASPADVEPPRDTTSDTGRKPRALSGSPPISLPVLPPDMPRAVPSPAAEALTRALALEISRAVAQGLVETPEPSFDAPATESTEPDPPSDTSASANVRIETAMDRATGAGLSSLRPQVAPGSCAPEYVFALDEWADDRPPGRQIAEARRTLLGEFDKANPEAIARLARLYINLSFGLEARQILGTYGDLVPDSDILSELAWLVETGGPGGAPKIAAQLTCPGAGALWAVLALPRIPSDQIVDTARILQTFSGLPAHLRRHLGPTLAARFAEAGDMRAVETISGAIARISRNGSPARVLAEARTDPGSPETNGALRDLAGGVHPDAGEALLLLLDALIGKPDPISQDLIDTAGILAFERQGTPDGQRLKAAEIRAKVTNGAFTDAFRTLADAARDEALADGLLGEVRQAALTALLRRGSDAQFLIRMLEPGGFSLAQSAGRPLRRELAERLLALGFPDAAQTVAEPLADATDADELDYAARLFLARGDPERAVTFARRSDDPDANRIVAEALAQARDHAAAALAFADLGNDTRSLEEAWRAGDWQRTARDAELPFRNAASAFLAIEAPFAVSEEPTLKDLRTRADASRDLRETIEALLSAIPETGR